MPFIVDHTKLTAHLSTNPGTGFTVYFYGATVTSWSVKNRQQLFLSKHSLLNGTKAIRIPIVFPQFGAPANSKLPQHGFARISYWKLIKYTENDTQITTTYSLSSTEVDPKLVALFNHQFNLEYDIVLTHNTLTTKLRLTNMDSHEFDFTWLLHTYIHVPSLENMHVQGLDGCVYKDKTRNLQTCTQMGSLDITEEVDRIFSNVPMNKIISVHVNKTPIMSIERLSNGPPLVGFTDLVTWNPFAEKAKLMSDFGHEDEFTQMVCVEVGNVGSPIIIQPGQVVEAGQVLTAIEPTKL